MCGRYHLTRADIAHLKEFYGVEEVDQLPYEVRVSYNVGPQSFQTVVRLNRDSGKREIALMRWGFVPASSKSSDVSFAPINARAETITKVPTFKNAFTHRRCLVITTGFYEWKKLEDGTKQPYNISLKSGEAMAFAGIWEEWKDPATGEILESFAVITTVANELVATIHDKKRMPVILRKQDYERWLAPCDPAQLPIDLLRPYPADEMVAIAAHPGVGNIRNNRPDMLGNP
jgi:putative SOS response-associated peptidase YedK